MQKGLEETPPQSIETRELKAESLLPPEQREIVEKFLQDAARNDIQLEFVVLPTPLSTTETNVWSLKPECQSKRRYYSDDYERIKALKVNDLEGNRERERERPGNFYSVDGIRFRILPPRKEVRWAETHGDVMIFLPPEAPQLIIARKEVMQSVGGMYEQKYALPPLVLELGTAEGEKTVHLKPLWLSREDNPEVNFDEYQQRWRPWRDKLLSFYPEESNWRFLSNPAAVRVAEASLGRPSRLVEPLTKERLSKLPARVSFPDNQGITSGVTVSGWPKVEVGEEEFILSGVGPGYSMIFNISTSPSRDYKGPILPEDHPLVSARMDIERMKPVREEILDKGGDYEKWVSVKKIMRNPLSKTSSHATEALFDFLYSNYASEASYKRIRELINSPYWGIAAYDYDYPYELDLCEHSWEIYPLNDSSQKFPNPPTRSSR